MLETREWASSVLLGVVVVGFAAVTIDANASMAMESSCRSLPMPPKMDATESATFSPSTGMSVMRDPSGLTGLARACSPVGCGRAAALTMPAARQGNEIQLAVLIFAM